MNLEDVMKNMRDNITALLDKHNISMRMLSLYIGKSESYIQKLVEGEFVPSLDVLVDIANYFGISPADLFSIQKQDILQRQKIEQITKQLARMPEETLNALEYLISQIR